MNKTVLLYDLVGKEDRRMSPFCWRAKLSLAHKNISFETEAVKFTEKNKIAFSGQEQLPVLVIGERTIFDSWNIACHLEENFHDGEELFAGAEEQTVTRIFNHWFDEIVTMSLFPLLVPDNFDVVLPEDLPYYTESRFRWLGKNREELYAERSEDSFIEWRQKLEPVREGLKNSSFLGGERPLYCDYIVFSMFMWARAVSPWPLLEADDVLYNWRERMLDLHDGLARKSPGYDC